MITLPDYRRHRVSPWGLAERFGQEAVRVLEVGTAGGEDTMMIGD